MALLTLNCPQCRKRLVLVPLDGLTLYYLCEEHGALILRPLQPVPLEDSFVAEPPRQPLQHRFRAVDAA